MSQEEEYSLLRERFADLCAAVVPPSKAEERRISAGNEFDRFCAHPKITFVAINDPMLAFATTRLVMDGPTGPRWAGEFIVRLATNTREIVCRNLSEPGRQGNGPAPHPHIFGASSHYHPCLGEANKICVAKLMGDGKLGELGLFMVGFLEQYGDSSYTEKPDNWMTLSEEEVTRWKTGR